MATTNQEAAAEGVTGVEHASSKPGGDDDGEQKKVPVMAPLPRGHVNAILSPKREPWPSSDYLDRLVPPDERRERLEHAAYREELDDDELEDQFQDEVDREVEETGGYMVDEESDLAELQTLIKEEWAKIDWGGIKVGEWDYDDPIAASPWDFRPLN